jgi:DNA polymerase-4
MHDLGLRTCGDIQSRSVAQLAQWFGSRAVELSELARGIDHRAVEPHSERKSLTVEETFGKDLSTLEECLARVPSLYDDWERRMLKAQEGDRIRGFVVKVKFFDFKSTTHEISSRQWPTPKDFEKLLERAWERRSDPVRLIGLGVRLASEESKKEKFQLSFAL